jgi:hypothetical protein
MLKPAEIVRPTPPATYAPVTAPQGFISPVATGIGGLIGGAIVGAGWLASRKLGDKVETEPPSPPARKENSGPSGKE